jgi:hypothetical protein
VLAKATEVLDQRIFMVTGDSVSGHTLKHILAAAGCATVLLMLARRDTRSGVPSVVLSQVVGGAE